MADGNFREDYTTRVQVRYVHAVLGGHWATFRFGNTVDPATLVSKWNAIAPAMSPLLFSGVTSEIVQWAPFNSSSFVPLPGATLPAGTFVDDYDPLTRAAGFNVKFMYTSSTGTMYYSELFSTPSFYNFGNKKSLASLASTYQDYSAVLIAQSCTAIDGNPLTARGYVLMGDNDSVERKARRL